MARYSQIDTNSLLTTATAKEAVTSTQNMMAEASWDMMPVKDRLRASRNHSMKNQTKKTTTGRLEWNLAPNLMKPMRLDTAHRSLATEITYSKANMNTANAKK